MLRALVVGDVDEDGDLDVLFGISDLFINQRRQLASPLLAMVGREYRLDVYARNRPPHTADSAVIIVAAGRARIPVPSLGTIGLDPVSMVPFPTLTIPQPLGSRR